MNPKRLLLVYPKLGLSGSLGRYIPLSLLYAAIDSIKAGFAIDIVDVRLAPSAWQAEIAGKMTPDTLLLGISVMTGTPIKNATEISQWAKSAYPQVKIVWGGPHATFNGEEILQTPEVDYAVGGYGSRPLGLLAKHLRGDADAPGLDAISGLLYRANGKTLCVPPDNQFEIIDYRDIPYHLVESNLARYGQLDTSDRIFSMYSVMGCPYQCAFCSSPAMYRKMKVKSQPLPIVQVVDHIEYVHQQYEATYIYFIDDDSFVNLAHVEAIIDELNRRGLKIRLGFRGARINEIKKMDDAYLNKLAAAGTNILHIGAESGSQRMLDLMRKNCTVEDIVAVNQKMARHPEIKTGYNWIVGIPGETLEDLRLTRALMLRLIEDNPNTLIFPPNKYRPLPGTEFYDLALKAGYQKPTRLEDWANVEVEGVSQPPWYSKEAAGMINMMQVVSYFIDNKVFKLETGHSLRWQLIRFLAWLYRPVALFRLRHGVSALLVENVIFRWAASLYRL